MEIRPLDSQLCTPVPQQLPSTTGTITCWSRIPAPALLVKELLSSQRAISRPEMLTYSREGADQPLRGGSPPSCGFQEHPGTRTLGAHVAPHPAALWHEVSGLEPAEAAKTESRLFTGKQFSLVFSHVWLQHTGLRAMPGEGHRGRWETEIFCVLPARLLEFNDGDPSNLIFRFTRNRPSGETKQLHGRMQERASLLGFPTKTPSALLSNLSITDHLSLPYAKQPSKHKAGRDGSFMSLNAFTSLT